MSLDIWSEIYSVIRPYKEEVQNITVHCLRQPEDEVHFMIEEIMALREQESFRYRDVAIVTGNMDIYGTLIKGEMERKGMPCFRASLCLVQ